jgi:NTP pyrophosphatase (non-canonical NTP hydrolase)
VPAAASRSVHALLGIVTEAGELADAFKKHIFYGKPLDVANVDEELGDLLWYIALLMDVHALDFEGCMARNIAKLKRRYPRAYSDEDAVTRRDKIIPTG